MSTVIAPATAISGTTGLAAAPTGALAGAQTWLCTLTVQIDMPQSMSGTDTESVIAQWIATAANAIGLPGNVSVTLLATQGNVTVATPTPGAVVAAAPLPPASPV